MHGFEAEGSAAIVQGRKIENPETIATAIRIGNPASWELAEKARDDSGGEISSVSDAEIIAAYKLIASSEGIFCEPSSAASVAGLLQSAASSTVQENATIVCVLTGNGLKDPDSAIAYGTPERAQLSADAAQVAEFFGFKIAVPG
jgi:threonine synthase